MRPIRLPVARRVGRALPILLSCVGLCCGCLHEPPEELAVWSEFLALDEVQSHLPTLARFDVELYLALRPDDVHDDLWQFWQEAQDAGAILRPWLQVPEHGVWLNQHNVPEFADFATRLIDAAEARGVTIEWLILDVEPGLAYAQALRTTAAAGGGEALLEMFQSHRDAEEFAATSAALRELVDGLHARGVRVMAATLPWTIDDLGDGDADIQDALDTPLAGIPWDQVSVMVYRPVFADLYGVPLTPGFVASYARSARAAFGVRAQIAIGNISTPGRLVPPGYTDPGHLRLDLSAARSAGVESVSLFSLDGMVIAGGPECWLGAMRTPTPALGFPDPITSVLRTLINWLDRWADQSRPAASSC